MDEIHNGLSNTLEQEKTIMVKESYSLNRLGAKPERFLCLASIQDAKRHAEHITPHLKWEGVIGEQIVDGLVVDHFAIEMPIYAFFGMFIWVSAH